MNSRRLARGATAASRVRALNVRKLALLLASLTVAVQFTPTTAIAQTAATGSIQGRVLNATNGMYLGNARVAVEGTNLETFTNQFGEYTLSNVPAGSATIRVTYTGQTPQVSTVTVAADATAVQDITFNAGDSTTGEDGTLVLNEFTVAANRFRNAQEIAINEQRSSVNIKNVISTDQFGDIPSGNVGELVKFLPGVQVDYGSAGGNSGYSDSDASAISVRGFGAEDTAILIDGLPVSSSVPGSLTRTVTVDQLSINNASRVELIKVATPDMPNNSIGGQVNLITKSAFELARPSYTGRAYFNVNSLTASLSKTAGPTNKDTFKTQPGFEVSASYPFSSTLGATLSASAANEATLTERAQNSYTYTGSFTNAAGQAPSISNPLLNRVQVTSSPRLIEKRSVNLHVDWKPTPSQVLRTNVQYGTYESTEAQRRMDFRPLLGAGADWSPTYVIGVAGTSGTTAMTVTTRDRTGETKSGQVQYSFKKEGWNIGAAASISVSTGEYLDAQNGHYSEVALNLNPGRVNLNSITDGVPQNVTTYWRTNASGGLAGTPKPYTSLNSWSFDGTTAKSGEAVNKSTRGLYKVDIERDLSFIPLIGNNPLSLKVGARRDEDKDEKSGRGSGYREILRPGASYTVANILDPDYMEKPGFNLPGQQWVSTYRLFQLNQEQNLFYAPDFDEATNTRVENYRSWVNQQKSITETTDAWYGMLSGRFFDNRLSFVGGARQEKKSREGRGPFTNAKWDYIYRADGTLYTDIDNPNGVQLTQGNGTIDPTTGAWIPPTTAPGSPNWNRPIFENTARGIALRQALTTAGIPFPILPYGPPNNSLASAQRQLSANRRVDTSIKGDPSYSLSLAYKLTSKIDLKASWSRSFGLPKLEDGNNGILSGNNQFTETPYTDTEQIANSGFLGQLAVANPGIKPQVSDNLEGNIAYYTDSGGILSVSYYTKTVTNQIQNFTSPSGTSTFNAVLGALGLDPSNYDNWRVVTTTNSQNDQKTSGWEFEVRQDFGFLGRFGRNIQTFVSYSMTKLAEPSTPAPYSITAPDGSIVALTPSVVTIDRRATKFGGAGIQYSGDRFSAQIRGTWREEDEDSGFSRVILPNGNLLRRYAPEETRIDVTLNYVLSPRYSLFLSGRDVFNAEREQILRDDQGLLPSYAEIADIRRFGVVWSVGVTGKF
ncbi:hypothetical protein CMV30_08595 [Nibricoccus aquaticus]|uniref:TonB-dependent receptor plug domain-containing protein n=1 Tax=Nibricoccus aquaticus TaxID=2576891 RepID=A0A290Q9X5_9BACT|nr:TonB-dependent receptor [Nibricoccus aquaticus]ATC64000.1 hypothetical protein CMV30_08595 [Nibricoccus aquaticus]